MEAITRIGVELAGRLKASRQGNVATQLGGLFDMYVDPEDQSLTPCLLRDGFWESWITVWTMRNIKPGMFCVDIGANQGYFTFLMAKLVGPEGHVQAFEPMPRCYHLLQETRTLGDYHNVWVYPFAISDQMGTANLIVPGYLRGSASIAVKDFGGLYGEEEVIKCRTVPLDWYATGRVDFIKIDAEGAEDAIWRGMQQVIQRNPQVVISMEFDARRGYSHDFIRELYETMHVTYIDFDGNEVPITEEELLLNTDWVMLVLRRNNS